MPKEGAADLKADALHFHSAPRPGKLQVVATKPLANQRDLALAYSPGVAFPCEAIAADPRQRRDLHRAPESCRGADQRNRRARPRRHRPARRQAGDGGQGGPVQEIRRHRCLRHRGGGEERRQARRCHRRARADVRRHQPRGHQGPRVFRGRGEGEGPDGHSRLPRRSARHGDHRFRGDRQRARTHRQDDRRGQDRLLRRGRGGARLAQSPRLARRQAREHHRLRHRGRRLQGPRETDGPLEGGLCARDERPHARRRHSRRRYLPWPVGRRRPQARDAQAHGERPAGDGARQSDAGNHAGIGARSAARRHDLHRPLRLSKPGQQRPVLPLHLPRRARRRRERNQRGDEEGRGRGDRGAGARDALRSRGPCLWRRSRRCSARPR